jgi:hypothetical protein
LEVSGAGAGLPRATAGRPYGRCAIVGGFAAGEGRQSALEVRERGAVDVAVVDEGGLHGPRRDAEVAGCGVDVVLGRGHG